MTKQEQDVFLSREYSEASRYMDNAKDSLQKANKEDDGYYRDAKYVRTACGTAYNGVLIALDAWLKLKGVAPLSKKQRKSIDYYMDNIEKIDWKLLRTLNSMHQILYFTVYCGGVTNVNLIQAGFEDAYEIIEKIKPETFTEVKDTRANAARRFLNRVFLTVGVWVS